MPKELKELLADDLTKRFDDLGLPGFLDKIADETIATDPEEIRSFMEDAGHPALEMEDMAVYAQQASDAAQAAEPVARETDPGLEPPSQAAEPTPKDAELTAEQIAQLKKEVAASVAAEIRGRSSATSSVSSTRTSSEARRSPSPYPNRRRPTPRLQSSSPAPPPPSDLPSCRPSRSPGRSARNRCGPSPSAPAPTRAAPAA
jgi:hypothetical protein